MAAQNSKAPSQGMDTKMGVESIFGASSNGDHPNGRDSSKLSNNSSLRNMNTGNEQAVKKTETNGRPIRANRGNTTQRLPGFVDSSTLVVDSSDGDDENMSKQDQDSDLDSNGNNMHTCASPELGTMHAPSTPALSPLPPAIIPIPPTVAPLPFDRSSIGWKEVRYQPQSNIFAGYLPGGSIVKPLKLSIFFPQGFSGELQVNIDRESIMQAERLFLAPSTEDHTKPSVEARNLQAKSAMEPLKFSMHIPYAHSGHAYANIDFDGIIRRTPYHLQQEVGKYVKDLEEGESRTVVEPKHLIVPKAFSVPAPPKPSFLELSGEIRNRIYRLVLRGEPVQFIDGENFERSGNILRANKQIYEETRRVLYGENDFIFERDPQKCGAFWQPNRSEIGYTNVRRFLEMIGPVNIGLIRLAGFAFEDAVPSSAPGKSRDERRYANDPHCLDVLKTFAKYGNLHKITIGLYGRRVLCDRRDWKFVGALRSIPADLVDFKHPRLSDNRRFEYLGERNKMKVVQFITDGMQKAKKARADAEVAAKKAIKNGAIEAAKKAGGKVATK